MISNFPFVPKRQQLCCQKHNKPSGGLDGKLLAKASGKELQTSTNHFLGGGRKKTSLKRNAYSISLKSERKTKREERVWSTVEHKTAKEA